MDQDVKIVLDWLAKTLPSLRNSGDNWQITLHGGNQGNVQREIKIVGQLLPTRKQMALEETKHRS